MAAPAPSAELWHSLFTLYVIAAFIVAGAVFVIYFYMLGKYRRKPGARDPDDVPKLGVMQERGSARIAVLLTVLLVVLFFGLTLNTFAINSYLRNPPSDPHALYIDVVGFQWGWRFVYPNSAQVIGEMKVPQKQSCAGSATTCFDGVVILNITSQDVFHSFGIPDFKVKADAIPGRVNVAWFEADQIGTFTIHCYELCGTGHALMTADLLVVLPDTFNIWYNSTSGGSP